MQDMYGKEYPHSAKWELKVLTPGIVLFLAVPLAICMPILLQEDLSTDSTVRPTTPSERTPHNTHAHAHTYTVP